MRSVEVAGLLLLVTALAGCGTRPVAVAPAPEPAAVATVKADAPAPLTAEPKRVITAATSTLIEPETLVSAATKRAFDDAVALQRAGRTADAERAFKALVAADASLGGAHANLGLIQRRAGRSEEAAASFEAAVKASPRQARWWNQLGIAQREAGHFERAREAYEQALALDANFASAHMNLAILNDLYIGNTAVALTHYMRCIELTPADAPQLNKWVAELKARKPSVAVAARKEKE